MQTAVTFTAKKSDRIIYWIFTSIVVLLDAVMPAFTFNTPLAKEGISHLGYPDYFRIELTIFKVLGGIVLIFPSIPRRIKEWAYFGFALDFISAFIGHVIVDGFNGESLFPLLMLIFLIISYVYYHKIIKASH
jgi:DoxX-like protein